MDVTALLVAALAGAVIGLLVVKTTLGSAISTPVDNKSAARIAVATAAAGALAAWVLVAATGNGLSPAVLPVLIAALVLGLAMATTDALTLQVPNWLAAAFTVVITVGVVVTALVAPAAGSPRWAVIGLLVFCSVYGGLWLISDGALIGGADAKVAPALGLLVGFITPPAVLLTIVAAFALANVWGMFRRTRRVAFLPHLLLGALLAIAVSPTVQSFYVSPGIVATGLIQ